VAQQKNNRVVTYLDDSDFEQFQALKDSMGLENAAVARYCIKQQLQREYDNE